MEEGNHFAQGQDVVVGQPAGQAQSLSGDAVFGSEPGSHVPQDEAVDFPGPRFQFLHIQDQARHLAAAPEGYFDQIPRSGRRIVGTGLPVPVGKGAVQGNRQGHLDQIFHETHPSRGPESSGKRFADLEWEL